MKILRTFSTRVAGAWLTALLLASCGFAETVSLDQARTAVGNWLAQYYPAVPESGYPALVKSSSANGRPVWQSYLLGLDPINAESEFRIVSFEMKDGEPIIKWNVDDARLDSFGYECRIKGKTYLTDLDWMEQMTEHRYFKAFVEPK